jgi:hypothetical protein
LRACQDRGATNRPQGRTGTTRTLVLDDHSLDEPVSRPETLLVRLASPVLTREFPRR